MRRRSASAPAPAGTPARRCRRHSRAALHRRGRRRATAPDRGFPFEVLRVVRLAVSAARADGTLLPAERALILSHAREAGVESVVEDELASPRPLSEIVAGITDDQRKRDLYVLAFTIVRADEHVSRRRAHLSRAARPPARARCRDRRRSSRPTPRRRSTRSPRPTNRDGASLGSRRPAYPAPAACSTAADPHRCARPRSTGDGRHRRQ